MDPGWYWVKWLDGDEWEPCRYIAEPWMGHHWLGHGYEESEPCAPDFIGPRCVPPWETLEEAAKIAEAFGMQAPSGNHIPWMIRANAEAMKPK
jgi:hypothetical protein